MEVRVTPGLRLRAKEYRPPATAEWTWPATRLGRAGAVMTQTGRGRGRQSTQSPELRIHIQSSHRS